MREVRRPSLPPGLPESWRSKLRINDEGCWLWSGAHRRGDACQQPVVSHRGRVVALARVIFAAVAGLDVERTSIRMRCDSGWRCVNPAHARRFTPKVDAATAAASERRIARRASWIPGLPARIAKRLEPIPEIGCWAWTGAVNKVTGYGSVGWKVPGRGHANVGAHRIVYVLLRCRELLEFGEYLPRHLHVHHAAELCIGKLCCNPDHLAIKDAASHARDHRLAEASEGRGWRSPAAIEKQRASQRVRPASSRRARQGSYKGVSLYGRTWRAVVYVGGRQLWLGLHQSSIDAALAFDAAAERHHGALAWLNRDHFPEVAAAYRAAQSHERAA